MPAGGSIDASVVYIELVFQLAPTGAELREFVFNMATSAIGMKIRTAMEAAGTALLLLPSCFVLLDPSHLALFHHGLPVNHLIEGYLIDLLGAFILVLGLLAAIQYSPPLPRRILNTLFAAFLLWRIIDLAIEGLGDVQVPVRSWWQFRMWACLAICMVSFALARFFPRVTQTVARAITLTTAAFSLSAVWMVPLLVRVALAHQSDSPNPVLSGPTQGASHQRIVWILFDELSYDQTFDHPAQDLELPNFNRFRASSISLSRLSPAGYHTENIIPSLLLGRRVIEVQSTIDGELSYKEENLNRWAAFDSNDTLFAVAQQNGWSTGVDGWYNPYCHLLAPVLNVCFWEPLDDPIVPDEVVGISEKSSAWSIAVRPLLPSSFRASLDNPATESERDHIQEYIGVMAHTQALIEDQRIHFVFLHLPIPHPPSIFDRQHHLLRPGGSYLDNLVLADDTLGVLLHEIDMTQSASQTTVIVSSDHSWRAPIWRHKEGWSEEDDRASGGQFDDRPVLMVHFPGQASGEDVRGPLPELLEHDIITAMLRGEIRDREDLDTYLVRGHYQ